MLSLDTIWLSHEALLFLGVLAAGWTVYKLVQFHKRFRTPLLNLQGPPSDSLLWGKSREFMKDDTIIMRWAQQYGPTYVVRVLFGVHRLMSLDPRVIAHVLSHTDIYQKPEPLRHILGSILGDGVLIAEGEMHKRQRRIMNPSFSPGQIREVTPIFFETGYQLCDVLNSMLSKAPESEGVEIDMYAWVGRAALDIIGLAGFGYRFNALYDQTNELFVAFHDMFNAISEAGLLGIFLNRFKILRFLPMKHNIIMKRSLKTTHRIGMELVESKKQAVQQEAYNKHGEKNKIVGRDILSSLIRANMAADLSPAHRMSDEEVLAQISTFIVAGHETTAAGLTWTLHSLAQNLEVQNKLRAELALVSEEAPSMDNLNALPYLDMVVKESLRFHCPVHGTVRAVMQDDEIPVSRPVVDRYGVSHDYVRVQAGDHVGIESIAINRSKELWGEDAEEFRPERWADETTGANNIPGIYAHMLTFIGGPRACIGYRFSVIETKALLYTLIRSFEFGSVEGKEIGMKDVIVVRPFVKGEEKAGMQLPFIVKRVPKAT